MITLWANGRQIDTLDHLDEARDYALYYAAELNADIELMVNGRVLEIIDNVLSS